ncbi:uncharacterized protein F4807DRAFT_33032 [Annulohypoxylon truncatum]|uniref:uncharacterized protein n=1 Tax=Annulohypoxylon truncatum TaxID=327061 RepID=UPI0020076652|nr:uncharacterized protein F4807DRAFT_33032 [Annulohypoxylon truncatum]KAI1211306.1 hypothetical protein F4807DRAFT_33032 [Annulohypoxylon truncatum]
MGIWDSIQDLVEAVTPWTTVEAEAPAEDNVRSPPHQKRTRESSSPKFEIPPDPSLRLAI